MAHARFDEYFQLLTTAFQFTDYWGPSKRLLDPAEFNDFDMDSVPRDAIRKIKKEILCKPGFECDRVKNTSKALTSVFEWCMAVIDNYEKKQPSRPVLDHSVDQKDKKEPKKLNARGSSHSTTRMLRK